MKFIILNLILITPFNIEHALVQTSNDGNMALHGVCLEIYYKRNLVYFSIPIFILSCAFNYSIYGLFLLIFSLLNFIYSCNKWSGILLNKN
jgi:hypothetical protein